MLGALFFGGMALVFAYGTFRNAKAVSRSTDKTNNSAAAVVYSKVMSCPMVLRMDLVFSLVKQIICQLYFSEMLETLMPTSPE